MLHIREAGQEAEQLLRIGVAKLLGSHIVATHIVRAINAIVVEVVEAGALVALVVFTLLENEVNKLLVRLLVGLGMVEHILHQLQCLRHILVESAEGDVQGIGIDTNAVVAGVELLLDIGRGELVGTYIVEIVAGHIIAVVVLMTEVIAEDKGEEVVVGILLIEKG